MKRPVKWTIITLPVVGIILALTKPWIDPTATPLYAVPSPLAKWPLPGAKSETLQKGVTHTFAQSPDGTQIDFIHFDFSANPRLRFEIFDQDEDDATPFDNRVLYWNRNVARIARELNAKALQTQASQARPSGPVIAAWNGAFFGYDEKTPAEDAMHLSPVVLRGKVYFNNANHRWTWGVKQTASGPQWKVFFKPDRLTLQREFDYAAGSVQCLIKDGQPLKTEPFPAIGGSFKPQPVPSTSKEAGHIPKFDHMRTCRASIAWSRDNRHLYLLTVKEPDNEGPSSAALQWAVNGGPTPGGLFLGGGWTVPDVQKFWLSKRVWGAINSDAGSVLQLVYRHPKGNYSFVTPRQADNQIRVECSPNCKGAVQGGGAIMYFLVRESQKPSPLAKPIKRPGRKDGEKEQARGVE